MDWFLYDNGLRHERVNLKFNSKIWWYVCCLSWTIFVIFSCDNIFFLKYIFEWLRSVISVLRNVYITWLRHHLELCRGAYKASGKGGRGRGHDPHHHYHHHHHFFWSCTVPGMFSWKLAFQSFSKAPKTFLAPAFPESHRGPCVYNLHFLKS